MSTTVKLDARVGGATEIVLTHERLHDAVAVARHTSGWSDSLTMIERASGKQRSIA